MGKETKENIFGSVYVIFSIFMAYVVIYNYQLNNTFYWIAFLTVYLILSIWFIVYTISVIGKDNYCYDCNTQQPCKCSN